MTRLTKEQIEKDFFTDKGIGDKNPFSAARPKKLEISHSR